MTNHYKFFCPVTETDTEISHCQEVHSNGMQGFPEKTESKLCALAHHCFMCPFRYASRVGGPWSKPDKAPKANTPQEKGVKLPREIIVGALAHTKPHDRFYSHIGVNSDDRRDFDEHLTNLQNSVLVKYDAVASKRMQESSNTPRDMPGARRPKQVEPSEKKPTSAVDAMTSGFNQNSMADAVSDLARQEKQSASKSDLGAAKQQPKQSEQPKHEKPAQSVSQGSDKPMTLAERARAMKSRKQA